MEGTHGPSYAAFTWIQADGMVDINLADERRVAKFGEAGRE